MRPYLPQDSPKCRKDRLNVQFGCLAVAYVLGRVHNAIAEAEALVPSSISVHRFGRSRRYRRLPLLEPRMAPSWHVPLPVLTGPLERRGDRKDYRSPLRHRRSGVLDGVELPVAGHALQRVDAPVGELDPRARDEVRDGAGDEHLAPRGGRADARADVHGDSRHIVADQLALARVKAGSDLDAELAHGVTCGAGAADSPRRPVQGR